MPRMPALPVGGSVRTALRRGRYADRVESDRRVHQGTSIRRVRLLLAREHYGRGLTSAFLFTQPRRRGILRSPDSRSWASFRIGVGLHSLVPRGVCEREVPEGSCLKTYNF